MKKSRILAVAGVGPTCNRRSRSFADLQNHQMLKHQKLMAIFILLTQKHWIISFQGNKVRKWLLQTESMASLQMINTGNLTPAGCRRTGLYRKDGLLIPTKFVKV